MRPHEDSNIGERVTLVGDNLFGEAGLSQEFQAVLNPKRKIEPKLLEKLSTSENLEGLFDGKKMQTSAGLVMAPSIAGGKIA